MIISLIAALTVDHIIGKKNVIPWYFPIDMQWFKCNTLYKPIIMGRRTFESMNRKPLLNRLNIVLSRTLHHNYDGVIVVDNPVSALSLIKDVDEVMVIGGSTVYNVFLPIAQRLYLTYIYNFVLLDGDVWFPNYNINEWETVFDISVKIKKKLSYDLNFKVFERVNQLGW